MIKEEEFLVSSLRIRFPNNLVSPNVLKKTNKISDSEENINLNLKTFLSTFFLLFKLLYFPSKGFSYSDEIFQISSENNKLNIATNATIPSQLVEFMLPNNIARIIIPIK